LFKKTGNISIYAAGEKNNHDKIRMLVEKELKNLAINGITKLELKIAKEQLKSNTIMALESMSARIQNIAKSELSLGYNESLNEIIEKIDCISIDDLNDIAGKYFFPENWSSIIFI
jgi:predicted Zn-dependent peptidase